MTTPSTHTSPLTDTWYHGTDAAPFEAWTFPPPAPSPADLAHTALFFTTNRAFAEGAGKTICTVEIEPDIAVITPALGGSQSTELRKSLLKSNPLAARCTWLSDDDTWIRSWKTGEVMRFACDASDPTSILLVNKGLALVEANLRKIIASPVSDAVIKDQAMQCLTRAWIEQIVVESRKLGHQAILGTEIDKWGGHATPTAEPWLAILDSTTVSPPIWL